MKLVIYARFSTELQNPKSCDDQEREIRAGLARRGIDSTQAEVIKDAAESAMKVDRKGFDAICRRIKSGEAFILAVDDQARFTRLTNAMALVTDLVYAGGRFISTSESIDTAAQGWKLKVRVLELHHSTCSDETGNRVRRGQRGRVIEKLSAGDYPFGYESYAIDPEYDKYYSGRGPKPARGIRINQRQSKWVLWIFQQFAERRSINWISRELTRRKVPRCRRARTSGWFAPTIRRMLSNPKYVGTWQWGKTSTIRNSDGKKKQVAVSDEEVVASERPELRIVPQDLWEQVQSRLVKLKKQVGKMPGQRSRRPIVHYTIAYPTNILTTLLACGCCGAKMHYAGSGRHTYRECANHSDGRSSCPAKTRVNAAKARTVLLDFVAGLLRSMPDWIATSTASMRAAIETMQARSPIEIDNLQEQLHEVGRRRNNLMAIAESGGVDDLQDFKQRLRDLDAEVSALQMELGRLEALPSSRCDMPSEEWIRVRLSELATTLGADERATAELLRDLIGTVRVYKIVPLGKKFGYQQLRFRIRSWRAIREAIREDIPAGVLQFIDQQIPDREVESPEFCLDVGGPHKLDLLAPQIAEMRKREMKWKDIAEITGISMDSAYQCWRRYIGALKDSQRKSCDESSSTDRSSEANNFPDSDQGAA